MKAEKISLKEFLKLPPGLEPYILMRQGYTRRQLDWLAEKGTYKKIRIDKSFLYVKPRPQNIRFHTGEFVTLLQSDSNKADKGVRGYRKSYITLYVCLV